MVANMGMFRRINVVVRATSEIPLFSPQKNGDEAGKLKNKASVLL